MTSFHAYSFLYDNVSSDLYDLKLLNFGDGGITDGAVIGNISLITQGVLRKSKVYTLGRIQNYVLEFPVIFGSYNNISPSIRSIIGKWLIGRDTYKKFQVIQDDMQVQGIWYNVIFTSAKPLYIGNMQFAFEVTAISDSPFAYSSPKSYTYTSAASSVNYNFSIYNGSANTDYLYPTTEITLNSSGTSFTLTNATDSNRASTFTGLSVNEVLTIDNDRQIISSSTGLLRLSNFNKNWFRLLNGNNSLNITGGIGNIEISYYEYLKIGG